MSHYLVAVFTEPNGEAVEELLAPYDENMDVDKYLYRTKEQLISEEKERIKNFKSKNYDEYLKDPAEFEKKNKNNPGFVKYVKEEFPEQLLWDDEQMYSYAIRDFEPDKIGEDGSVYSTYNPESKWDWYSIGGRWGGGLLLKPCSADYHDYDEAVNSALVSDIDFEKMSKLDAEELTPYEEYLKQDNFYKPEYIKEMYPDEETYIFKNTQFSTYAVVTPDGEWHAPGDMGWFACSSETPDEYTAWVKGYRDSFIKPAIENGWRLTMVDCHI